MYPPSSESKKTEINFSNLFNLHSPPGPNKHTLTQIKDAVHDGLRAVKNALDDGAVVPGAGAFEVAVYTSLMEYKKSVKGRARLGIQVRIFT